MIYKRCLYCQSLYQQSTRYGCCPECAKKKALADAKKRQQEDEGRKLYGSAEWKKCRKNVRLRYMDYDIWLMGIGIIKKCDKPYIHHIIERERGELVFDLDNLITVSKESHEEIHKAYKLNRRQALERIAEGIRRFKELMNDDS